MTNRKPNKAITRSQSSSAPDNSSSHIPPQQNTQQTLEILSASFSGPLPDPAMLKAFDIAVPGLAERIVVRWEKQSDHRMDLEKIVIKGDDRRANWGLFCATMIALAVLGVCYALAISGHDTVAAVLAGMDLAVLVGVFIYGTESRKKERIEKTKIMTGQASDD